MALVHDMAEAIVGDITPMDGVTKVEKSRRERESIEYMTRGLLGGGDGSSGLRQEAPPGEEMLEIWEEYEQGETLESQFVHDVDKMELLLQMVEYERRYLDDDDDDEEGLGLDLREFLRVADWIKLEEVKVWCKEIMRERQEWVEVVGRRKEAREARKHSGTVEGKMVNGSSSR